MNAILLHWPSLLLLALSAVPASFMHAHDHGRFNGWGDPYGFFGRKQDLRKYKNRGINLIPAFWGSTTFLVALTDAYHASQALMRILMSLSITLEIGTPWWTVIAIWWTYAGIHAAFYKLLSR